MDQNECVKVVVGIDMDNTICNFVKEANKNFKNEFNEIIPYDDIYIPRMEKIIWERLSDNKKAEYKNYNELKDIMVPVGFFEKLEPLGDSVNSIKKLYNAGCKIIFITKPMEWKFSTSEKYNWLKKYFSDIQYSVAMVDSMQTKKLFNFDVLVDDDAYALMKLPPYSKICINTPWNKEYREKSYEGISVDNFDEAAKFILNNLDFYSQKDKEGLDAPKYCSMLN